MNPLEVTNRLLCVPNGAISNALSILQSLEEFISVFENDSSYALTSSPDELRPMLSALKAGGLSNECERQYARALKILLRKKTNRENFGVFGMQALRIALQRQSATVKTAAADLCNAVLNSCFDIKNVKYFIDDGGLPVLTALLRFHDYNVQASALGAIQGIFYASDGRVACRGDAEV